MQNTYLPIVNLPIKDGKCMLQISTPSKMLLKDRKEGVEVNSRVLLWNPENERKIKMMTSTMNFLSKDGKSMLQESAPSEVL